MQINELEERIEQLKARIGRVDDEETLKESRAELELCLQHLGVARHYAGQLEDTERLTTDADMKAEREAAKKRSREQNALTNPNTEEYEHDIRFTPWI